MTSLRVLSSFIFSVVCWASITVCGSFAAQATDVIDISDQNQIFIGGRYLDSAKDVSIEVCRPVKSNHECLVGRLGRYSTIVKPDGQCRWYSALTKDGLNWRRVSGNTQPEADDVLGVIFGAHCVFADPDAPPAERYKLFSRQ